MEGMKEENVGRKERRKATRMEENKNRNKGKIGRKGEVKEKRNK